MWKPPLRRSPPETGAKEKTLNRAQAIQVFQSVKLGLFKQGPLNCSWGVPRKKERAAPHHFGPGLEARHLPLAAPADDPAAVAAVVAPRDEAEALLAAHACVGEPVRDPGLGGAERPQQVVQERVDRQGFLRPA